MCQLLTRSTRQQLLLSAAHAEEGLRTGLDIPLLTHTQGLQVPHTHLLQSLAEAGLSLACYTGCASVGQAPALSPTFCVFEHSC